MLKWCDAIYAYSVCVFCMFIPCLVCVMCLLCMLCFILRMYSVDDYCHLWLWLVLSISILVNLHPFIYKFHLFQCFTIANTATSLQRNHVYKQVIDGPYPPPLPPFQPFKHFQRLLPTLVMASRNISNIDTHIFVSGSRSDTCTLYGYIKTIVCIFYFTSIYSAQSCIILLHTYFPECNHCHKRLRTEKLFSLASVSV